MRKALLFLCALLGLSVSGAWADVTMPTLTTNPSNPVLYCIQSYRAYTFVQYAGDDAAMTPTYDFTSDNAKFYFVSVNGTDYSDGVKIVSYASGKQINEMSGFAEMGTTWYLGESSYASGCFNISKNSSISYPCWDCNSSGGMTAGYYNPNTEGSTWQIMSVDDLPQYQVSTLESPKWYYLKTGRGRYVYADGSNAGTNTTNPKTDAYKFAFISTGNHGVNIVSKVGLDAGNNQYLTTTPGLSSEASAWYYYNAVRYDGYFVLSDANNDIGYPHLLNDNGAGGLAKWYVDGTGSYFQVEEVIPVCDVTYTYTYGGNNYTVTETQNIGAPVSLPASITFPYTNYSFDTDVVPDAATATVNVTVTGFNMPFTASTDYASATWYYMNVQASYTDRYVSSNGDAIVSGQGKSETDAYKWAFIGNPIDGIKIINKAAGSTKFLQETDPLTMATTDKSWTIKQQTNTGWQSGANGFGFWSEVNNKYVNMQDGTLKYWQNLDQGSTFWVTEATVAVTYELWVGGVKVNEVVDDAAQFSAVDVPSALTANYSALSYNFATSGTIGNEDCTITVTATLKSNVITALNQLSNSKTYTLTTERGALYIKSDHLASTHGDNAGATPGEFALINIDDNYYLYSVGASKFVLNDGTLSTTVTSNVVALTMTEQTIQHLYLFILGSKGVNVTDTSDGYELVINNWTTADAGNRYCIVEAGDFDATAVVAALNEFLHGETAFNNTIAALKAINWGLQSEGNKGKVNYYNVTSEAPADIYGFYGNEMAAIETLEGNGYSAENLQAAQAMLANTALNLPETGKFYRIKGYSNNYITSNTASSNASMNGTASANNIIYYNESKNLIFFGSGYGLYNTSIVAPVGSTLNAYTFSQGAQSSHYYITSNASSVGTYCYDNTAHTDVRLDRNGSPVTSGSYQTDWTLEEVSSLPVTISAAGYATFCSPVAVTIPEGVTAYVGTLDHGDYLHLEAIEGGIIPANEGVILKGTAGTYDFNLTTGGSSAGNLLTGTVAAIARPADSYVLSGGDRGLGFYKDGAETIPGFKAYLRGTAGVKGFLGFIFDDADAIENIVKQIPTNDEYYDLSGRRVSKPTKGMYIINGKKVLVK